MNKKRKITLGVLGVVLLVTVSNLFFQKHQKEEFEQSDQNFEIEILKRNKDENLDETKISLLISEKISKGEILEEVKKIQKKERIKTSKQYFFFYLPQMNPNLNSWASYSLNEKKEDIKIYGTTREEEIIQKESVSKISSEEIVGKWYEPQKNFVACSLVKDKRGKNILYWGLKDGGVISETVIIEETSKGIKLIPEENSNGEYYIIEGEQLGFYNKENIRYATGWPF